MTCAKITRLRALNVDRIARFNLPRSSAAKHTYFTGFCFTSTVVRNGVDFYGSLEHQESLLFAAFCGYYILEVMSVGVEMKAYGSVQSSTFLYRRSEFALAQRFT